MTTSPLLTLINGVQMPAIGLGVFQSSPEDTVTAIESAIAAGYRLIDTAASYFNERQVGEGVRRSGISATRTRCTHSTRAPASSASSASTCCCCINRCRAVST